MKSATMEGSSCRCQPNANTYMPHTYRSRSKSKNGAESSKWREIALLAALIISTAFLICTSVMLLIMASPQEAEIEPAPVPVICPSVQWLRACTIPSQTVEQQTADDLPADDAKDSVFVLRDIPLPDELQYLTSDVCEEYGVPVDLAFAVMHTESRFRVDALGHNKNGTTDHGLMQINSVNHTWLRETLDLSDIDDPEQNIRAGVYMLSVASENAESDNLEKTLMVYHFGPNGARRRWENGTVSTIYTETVLTFMAGITAK